MEVTLTVNGETKFTETVGADGAVTHDAFQFNAAADANAEGVVTIAETGGYDLYIDGAYVGSGFKAAEGQVIDSKYSGKYYTVDTTALVLTTDDLGTALGTKDENKDGVRVTTISLLGLTPDEDGHLNLISEAAINAAYAKVTIAHGAKIASFDVIDNANKEDDTIDSIDNDSDAAVFYVKKGTALEITTDAITFADSAEPDEEKDVLTVTIGEDETKVTGTWTEGTDTWTAVFEYENVSADVTLDIDLDTALAEP